MAQDHEVTSEGWKDTQEMAEWKDGKIWVPHDTVELLS